MRLFVAVPCAVVAIVSGAAGCGAGAGGQTAVNEIVVPAVPPATPAGVASAPASASASGTGSEPAVEEAAEPEEKAEFGMIGLLNSGAGGDPGAPTTPWGSDDSIGDSLKGGLMGAGVGDSGLGGLGLVGGVGTVPALGGASGHARVTLEDPQVSGRLPPEVIKRIVRTNVGRYRVCFENGLKVNPKLQGRVRVRFVIGRDGAVSNVSNGGSDLPDADVIGCVVRSFYGLSFPQPDGGVVTVLSAISFTPGAPAAAAKPAAPAAPAAPSAAPAPKP